MLSKIGQYIFYYIYVLLLFNYARTRQISVHCVKKYLYQWSKFVNMA
jgi:hypothetical protein